jgi:hypothetical protein
LKGDRLEGGWALEPISDLLERMKRSGPYKYEQYRILPVGKPVLDIKPTCAGCGALPGTDCQRSFEYIFGEADNLEALPVVMNEDHQFNLSVDVVIGGKNFGKKKAKTFWFNSVRCAELFLMQHGYCRHKSLKPIGSGERLAAYFEDPKATNRGRASRRAKELVWGSGLATPV